MPKSRSRRRKRSTCENCFLCEKVTEIDKYNETSNILANVNQWDVKTNSQFKQITNYDCCVCHFETNKFIEWKCHIMSITHLADCHKTNDLYSHVCVNKVCKKLLYGSKKSLQEHYTKHSKYIVNDANINGLSIIMAEVMQRFTAKVKKPWFFCSYCKKNADTPVHKENKVCTIDYYCRFCEITFYSKPEMIDFHSLSVEHLTIKCFDELCSKAKKNFKKIKLSDSSDQRKETMTVPFVKNTSYAASSINLPMIILNRFKKMNQYHSTCKLCNALISWDSKLMVSHLFLCEFKFVLKSINDTSINYFRCNVCNYSTCNFVAHQSHITSHYHLAKCHDTSNYFSYCCNECNLYMYGSEIVIKNHWELNHRDKFNFKIPKIFIFMANVFKDFNTNPSLVETEHTYYYGTINYYKDDGSPFRCNTCKIEFTRSSAEDYYLHRITNEHIILKCVTPKLCVVNENKITKTLNTNIMKPVQKVQVNTSQTGPDIYSTANVCMDNVINTQKPLVNSVHLEKSDGIDQNSKDRSSSNSQLTENTYKLQYAKYYKHKINLLNMLQKGIDRIMKTLSYYCHECDFLTEEKPVWDKHFEKDHPSHDSKSTIFCSSCCILIVGGNHENHNKTIEHLTQSKFLHSNISEGNLIKETTILLKTVENGVMDEIPSNLKRTEQLGFNMNNEVKVIDFQCSTNYVNNGNGKYEEDVDTTCTIFPLDNIDGQNEHEQSTTINSSIEGNLKNETILLKSVENSVMDELPSNLKRTEPLGLNMNNEVKVIDFQCSSTNYVNNGKYEEDVDTIYTIFPLDNINGQNEHEQPTTINSSIEGNLKNETILLKSVENSVMDELPSNDKKTEQPGIIIMNNEVKRIDLICSTAIIYVNKK